MKVILNVPDEGYSRNASCALNLISTFLFEVKIIDLFIYVIRSLFILYLSQAVEIYLNSNKVLHVCSH
jgi:hypothetical protein